MPTAGPSPNPRAHRRCLTAAAGISLTLALAACGSDAEQPDTREEPTESTETAGAVTLSGEWPLTGETLEGDLPDHPVYVVKIDNTSSSAPQVGLDSADVIVEELVEGGSTRLAVFYYSGLPDEAGPVRSARASDIGIVKPVSATVVASGGAPKTVNRLERADIATLTEGAPGYFRDDGRAAPYNLFVRLSETADEPGSDDKPPLQPYFSFGDEGDFAGDIPAQTIEATFSGGHTTAWQYADGGWTRPGSSAENGDDFVADNVLLVRVKVGDAGYLDPAGNPVPETEFYGKGEAVLVHGDKAIKCRWRKPGLAGAIRLIGKDGSEVQVPRGRTWIELIPAKDGEITVSP